MQMLILHFYTLVCPGTRNNTTGLDVLVVYFLTFAPKMISKWFGKKMDPQVVTVEWWTSLAPNKFDWAENGRILVGFKSKIPKSEIIYSQNSFEIWSPKRMRQEENLWNHQQEDTNHTALELPFFVKILESKKISVNTCASKIWTPNTWNGGPIGNEGMKPWLWWGWNFPHSLRFGPARWGGQRNSNPTKIFETRGLP